MKLNEIIPGLKAPVTAPSAICNKAARAVHDFYKGERNFKRLNENRTGYYKIDIGPFWRLLSRDEGQTWIMHILADREHSFWRNVNAVSGFA